MISPSRPRNAGIALVLVLWVVALLSMMALTLIATQRTESALTRNLIDAGQGRALAEAGIYFAIARGQSNGNPTAPCILGYLMAGSCDL